MKVFIAICLASILVSCTEKNVANSSEKNKNDLVNETPKITDGEFVEMHGNGNLKTKGMLKNGKREGEWASFFANGSVQSENKYSHGLLNGKTAAYYPNGRVQYVGMYLNNQKDGVWYFYLEDGSLDKEIIFKDGKKLD